MTKEELFAIWQQQQNGQGTGLTPQQLAQLQNIQRQDPYGMAQYRQFQSATSVAPRLTPSPNPGWLPPANAPGFRVAIPGEQPWLAPRGVQFQTPDGRWWAGSPTTGQYMQYVPNSQISTAAPRGGYYNGQVRESNIDWDYLTNPARHNQPTYATGDINPATGGPSMIRGPGGSFRYQPQYGYVPNTPPYSQTPPQFGVQNPNVPYPQPQQPSYGYFGQSTGGAATAGGTRTGTAAPAQYYGTRPTAATTGGSSSAYQYNPYSTAATAGTTSKTTSYNPYARF